MKHDQASNAYNELQVCFTTPLGEGISASPSIEVNYAMVAPPVINVNNTGSCVNEFTLCCECSESTTISSEREREKN